MSNHTTGKSSETKIATASRYAVDPKMLEMLACPLTKTPLVWKPEKNELISRAARLAYPVRDGVPIMLPSEARTLDDDEYSR